MYRPTLRLVLRSKIRAPCRVVWNGITLCEVAPFLEGEIPNGMDDNGNGLIDERGLSFTFDRHSVRIRLTTQARVDGELRVQTVETTVTR